MQNFSPQSTNRVFVAVTLLLSFFYAVEIFFSTISTLFIITWQLIGCKMGVFSTLFHTSSHSPFMAFSWHFVAFGYRQALRRCSEPSGFPPARSVRNVHSVLFCPQRTQRVLCLSSTLQSIIPAMHFIHYSSFYPFRTLRYSFLAHSCSGVERFQRVLASGRVIIADDP